MKYYNRLPKDLAKSKYAEALKALVGKSIENEKYKN